MWAGLGYEGMAIVLNWELVVHSRGSERTHGNRMKSCKHLHCIREIFCKNQRSALKASICPP